MAHFAKINNTNTVEQVIVVHNDVIQIDGIDNEQIGIEFCQALFGGNWLQTSYNNNFRYNFANIGYIYDPIDDAFIPPIPCEHEELELNEFKRWICSNVEHEIEHSESS